MLSKLIDKAVKKYLDRCIVAEDQKIYPHGYNPLPVIKGCLTEWLYVPFNRTQVLMKIRYPNDTQLSAGGFNFGRITAALQQKEIPDAEMNDLKRQMVNAQEYVAKIVMCRPRYEEFAQLVYQEDDVVRNRTTALAEMKQRLADNPSMNLKEAETLRLKINEYEYFVGILLPVDTMTALFLIGTGYDVSDIQKLTKEKLKQAALKSEIYQQPPHNFLSGVFTDRDAIEIDAVCFNLLQDIKKEYKKK